MEKLTNSENPLVTELMSYDLINQPGLNKGTAFTETERDLFHLHGLLPPHVGTLEEQTARRIKLLRGFETDFERYAYLRDLQDTNETLFYAVLVNNLEELLPIVYTPTVGEGCQRFSEIWRKPRGIFLSYANKHRIREILADKRFDRVRVIVVTDGERILGLGDQGAGGMGISIGKLALYVGCAGIHPEETLPVLLDVGTNNQERMTDPLYVGWRHARITGAEYDEFVEEFVAAVMERWPDVLLQWEDFAGNHAGQLLERYRHRLCTFNDDIQSTASVALATLLAAVKVTGIRLTEQRVVLLGAGAAGCGILSLMLRAMIEAGATEEAARSHFYAVDRNGLLVEGMPHITPQQAPFAQKKTAVSGWNTQSPGKIALFDIIANARPTVLIGVSGQFGAFTEPAIRLMAEHVERPIIFPLSNPTSRSEATLEQLVTWTDGRALVGTGSPYKNVTWKDVEIANNQTNNSYIFPGMGLGILAVGAKRVTDAMFMVAGKAVAAMSPALTKSSEKLLPPVNQLRDVAVSVAKAVARQAQLDEVATVLDASAIDQCVANYLWQPHYRQYARPDERT
jgi:malate dehydrogenase (oxaloacetate-decarboxylating)